MLAEEEKYLSNIFLTFCNGNSDLAPSSRREYEEAFIQLPGDSQRQPILEICTSELSFYCTGDLPEEGLEVRSITVFLPNGLEFNADARVKEIRPSGNGHFVCRLALSEIQWPVYRKLFSYIFEKNYPALKPVNSFPESQIYDLFHKSGYLNLKSRQEMDSNFKKMLHVLDRIGGKMHITTNLVYHDNDRALTIGSALRIYDRTFLGHHLASLPEAKMNLKSKMDVYLGLVDFMSNHPYFQYYLAYFDDHLSWHDKMYKRFYKFINDENKFYYDSMHFFECRSGGLRGEGRSQGFKCTALDSPEEFLDFCQAFLPPILVNCYHYRRDHFNLMEVRQLYEMLDLYTARRLWRISRDGRLEAYAVAETFTDGLNLYNLLDMCRVYPANESTDLNAVLRALLPGVAMFFRNFKKDRFNVFFGANGRAAEGINIPGLNYHALAGRVIVGREAAIEYRKLLNQLTARYAKRNH